MRTLKCLCLAALSVAVACAPGSAKPAIERSGSHEATFVTLSGGDTLSVEHVRDVAGGYVGEIIFARGVPWIRYRVWTGPTETVTRIDMDMASMGGLVPRDVLMPLLTARRSEDSILVTPTGGLNDRPALRMPVSISTLLAMVYSTASHEQLIRRARALGPNEKTIPLVEPMNGQVWNATVTPLAGEAVRVTISDEVWIFECDRGGRIRNGRYSGAAGRSEVKYIDPRKPLPVNQTVSLPDSARQVALDAIQVRWERHKGLESELHRVLASRRSPDKIVPAVDRLIEDLHLRGGAYQAQLCVAAATSLRGMTGGLAAAERYAHRAVAYADAHDVLNYGDNGLVVARTASRNALADVMFAQGRIDSAYIMVHRAAEMLAEFEEFALQRDNRISLSKMLEASGRYEEAIGALFEAVALDTTRECIVAGPALRASWRRRFGDDADLDSRIKLAHGRKWAQAIGGGQGIPVVRQAPSWALPDLAGRVTRSTAFTGRPMVLVFWGGWTGPNRVILRAAEGWHQRRKSLEWRS